MPPYCANSEGSTPNNEGVFTCVNRCEYHPPVGVFSPEVKYAWGSPSAAANQDSVMMSPVVIQLDDDNCDSVVDEKDIPEIVFSTFSAGAYTTNGTLHAISIVKGAVVEKWKVAPSATDPLNPGTQLAAGNIDGLPGNEIVTCTATTGRARAYKSDGTELWTSVIGSCAQPSIADVNGDGQPEVITESQILDGKTGSTVVALPAVGETVVVDITGDGVPEIVQSTIVMDNKGVVLASAMDPNIVGGGIHGGRRLGVADLDKDGTPEIITVNQNGNGAPDYTYAHTMNVWRYEPSARGKVVVVRRDLDINGLISPNPCPVTSGGYLRGGGPATVADFNGDGFPDIGLAGGIGYVVLDGSKIMTPSVTNANTILWIKPTHDCSSAGTGSSVFDFDGDGQAEVVYSDEYYFRIYRGIDGKELFRACNTTGTLWEYPLVADVDNDGHADVIVVSNSYSGITCPDDKSKQAGVRIFGDKSGKWVRTRRIWNQHAYHVTNVEEDGSIPAVAVRNWTQLKLNNFRQNVQPEGEFSAPDLVAQAISWCDAAGSLAAKITNVGQAAVEAPIEVGFYDANNIRIGSQTTSITLFAGESETIIFKPSESISGPFYVIVDDSNTTHPWHECNVENNRSDTQTVECVIPI